MTEGIKAKINSLRHSINEHNYAYYVLDNPVLSDQEYDSLFRQLEKLEKKIPSLLIHFLQHKELDIRLIVI